MKICEKCGKKFPSTIIIDGKRRILGSRKYCLECSPFGKRNTKKLILNDKCMCKKCDREFVYNRKRGDSRNLCASCKTAIRREKTKKEAVDFLGGKCIICGYNKYPQAIVFHHKDPKQKEYSISEHNGRSFKTIKKEVEKCVLMCIRCHIEWHVENR